MISPNALAVLLRGGHNGMGPLGGLFPTALSQAGHDGPSQAGLASSTATPGSAAVGQATGEQPQGALQELLRGGQRYQQRTGHADPLASMPQSWGRGLQQQSGPGALLGGAAGLRQSGPRAGTAFQEFGLGGGRYAHVSYDPQGKRQVFVFKR